MRKAGIRCTSCSLCLIVYGMGFSVKKPEMLCSDRSNKPVTEEDGCTLGVEGKPKVEIFSQEYEVDISLEAAVNGDLRYNRDTGPNFICG